METRKTRTINILPLGNKVVEEGPQNQYLDRTEAIDFMAIL